MLERLKVKRGVACINARKPHWRSIINPDIFDIDNGNTCILGQVYGSYDDGLKQLGLSRRNASHFGFVGTSSKEDMKLQELWLKELRTETTLAA